MTQKIITWADFSRLFFCQSVSGRANDTRIGLAPGGSSNNFESSKQIVVYQLKWKMFLPSLFNSIGFLGCFARSIRRRNSYECSNGIKYRRSEKNKIRQMITCEQKLTWSEKSNCVSKKWIAFSQTFAVINSIVKCSKCPGAIKWSKISNKIYLRLLVFAASRVCIVSQLQIFYLSFHPTSTIIHLLQMWLLENQPISRDISWTQQNNTDLKSNTIIILYTKLIAKNKPL